MGNAFDRSETVMGASFVRQRALIMIAMVVALLGAADTHAQFVTQTPPNIPLKFGMTPEQVSQALGVQLIYVRGRAGDELLLALPNVKGAALASRSDGLYLQFRNGRLSGWKGDWGSIRP
jgi:alkylhydroperoxidase/carboxymuconolactone decarboxylase family protein YurZ